MKIKVIIICIVMILIAISFPNSNIKELGAVVKPIDKYEREDSTEKLYKDTIITLLFPYIEKATNDFYSNYLSYPPEVQPWLIEVLSVERITTAEFLVKLQVKPFVGAHYQIGLDQITFRVPAYNHGPKVEKYEHRKSYQIPSHLQYLIKKWPPK